MVSFFMLKSLRKFSATCRCTSIALSFLFLTFLVGTQPHRVHHFFEALSHTHSETIVAADDCDHDHNQKVPAQTRCVIQSAAQNSHLGQIQLVQIPFVESAFETRNAELTQRIQYFSFYPFLRRAPPIDVLFS
jgi:hypothetical protein